VEYMTDEDKKTDATDAKAEVKTEEAAK